MHLLLYRTTSSNLYCSSQPYFSRKIALQFSSLTKMNRCRTGDGYSGRGRGSSPSGNSAISHDHVGRGGKERFSHTERLQQGENSARVAGSSSIQHDSLSASKLAYEDEYPPLSASISSSSKIRHSNKSKTPIERKSEEAGDISSLQLESSPMKNFKSNDDGSYLPTSFGKKGMASSGKRREQAHSYHKYAAGVGNSDWSESLPMIEPFDICLSESRKSVRLKPCWRAKNGENHSEVEQSMEGIKQVLRPGMVLLKSYITHSEQIEIVKKCRELGLGPGGFYQPVFRDGAKLRLQMMCLGLNWDHETRKYERRRPVDGCKPPDIPHEFSFLVERAIHDTHVVLEKDLTISNVENILPRISPNICIVNFYTTSGRLGLHQDRDESKESLNKGLPVVSFSVGDSAEFLYGDQRDVDKAGRVLLESGDILIFGGESRHIFHGVSNIIPNSAPASLLEEAKIRPGRLNLTFRQF